MNLRAIAAVAALAAGLAAPVAWAKTTVIAKSGSWEVFNGTLSNGLSVCGISAEPGGKYVGLKIIPGRDLVVQIGGKSLPVPKGEKVTVNFRFDANANWSVIATGIVFDDNDPGLEFSVNAANVGQFFQQLRNSSTLRIVYSKAGLSDWIIGLEGTAPLADAFEKCRRNLK